MELYLSRSLLLGGEVAMAESCRSWWRNCALEADPEILDIDRMEDKIAPLSASVSRIRELISSLELCHHKADRWVCNIIEAIGHGETAKGLGTRLPGQHHPVEDTWRNACAALSAWCAGCPIASVDLSIDSVPASRLLAGLGERSPLKEWQVQRVVEKIRSLIHWPQGEDDPAAQYVWILLGGGEYEADYRSRCPEHYKEHEEFWLATVRTIIQDTEGGNEAELSLGLAIDMLWPCHWNFVQNLQIVLEAIGGKLRPPTPYAACGRNVTLVPLGGRMQVGSNTLRVFCGHSGSAGEVDAQLMTQLGQPTDVKRWLAASLDKTIRLQLNPPADLRAMSALAGPAWIKQPGSG
jgi:hypothetical protein